MGILGQINSISDIADRLQRLEDNVRNNNEILMSLSELDLRLERAEENLRQNNQTLSHRAENEAFSQISSKVEALKKRMDRLERMIAEGQAAGQGMAPLAEAPAAGQEIQAPLEGRSSYGDIDYFDFENHFRGSREAIMERQKEYLPYFAGKKAVLDLGCGRGEFLELLRDNGIPAKGVDLYDEFVCYCQGKGLDVVRADAIAYLSQGAAVDGIFAGQLVEHLSIGQILALCTNAYERLEEGGYLILETPNPMSLAIYTHAFYLDPSHQKPVHPYTLQYLAQKAGFGRVEILFTQGSRLPEPVPIIKGDGVQNVEEFNRHMQAMAEYMYGSQDYAVIAQK